MSGQLSGVNVTDADHIVIFQILIQGFGRLPVADNGAVFTTLVEPIKVIGI
jgi:hypothetical protein